MVTEALAPNLDAVRAEAERFEGEFASLARLLVPNLARIAATTTIGPVAKMVIGESQNFPELARVWHDALVAKALALVSSLIANAQRRGEVKPGDPRHYALSLISPLWIGVLWRETFTPIGASPFDLEALASQHLDTVLDGMLAKAGR